MLVWAVLTTALNTLRGEAATLPPLATTNYPAYVVLRFSTMLSFLATVYLTYLVLRSGHRDAVLRWTVIIGTIVAIAAFYIYFAQLSGLPELPRTRIGTSGAEQATRFTYAFHRAMGPFREPAYLAEWLVLPFMLSLSSPATRPVNVQSLIIGGALLLTGSLTGIVGCLGGIVAALVTTRGSLLERSRGLVRFGAIVGLAGLIFVVAVRSYQGPRPSLVMVTIERLGPVLRGGLLMSNRGYIYQYARETPVTLVGSGYGNANLILSNALGSSATASFLSLYLYTLYSGGIMGLALLLLGLLAPVIQVARHRGKGDQTTVMVIAAYFAWLIMFAVSSEELQLMFAVAYGLVAYESFRVARPARL